jgi:hypothetical protein
LRFECKALAELFDGNPIELWFGAARTLRHRRRVVAWPMIRVRVYERSGEIEPNRSQRGSRSCSRSTPDAGFYTDSSAELEARVVSAPFAA